MDLVSHILMGAILAVAVECDLHAGSAAQYALASLAPDLCFIPLGAKLGRERRRLLWIPHHADWTGSRRRYPVWVAWSWDLPYSLLGLAAIGTLAWWFGALGLFSAYALHVAVDYASHEGEWAIRPFYPFSPWQVPSPSNSWQWPLRRCALAWCVLGAILCLVASIDRSARECAPRDPDTRSAVARSLDA